MAKRTIIFILLLILMLCVALPLPAAADGDRELSFTATVPAGRESSIPYLTDNDYRTRFTLTTGQTLSIAWEGEAGGVMLQWFDEKQWYSRACGATIRLYDPEGKLLWEKAYDALTYRMFLPAEGGARMEIKCAGGRAPMVSLCEIKVYAPGYGPTNTPRQEPVDLMLILSSVSDELDMLGGLLPLYAGEHGIKTAVIFVGRDDGDQVQEAFCALEAMGLDVIPLFLQQEDHLTPVLDRMGYLWRDAQLRADLVDLLSRYAPKVVVTCDPDDQDTRVRAQYTAMVVQKVITSNKLPVQKLYQVSKNGQTMLDGAAQLAVYGGRTAVEVAREGYAQYRSEASFGTVIPESPRFALTYTTVGEDEAKDDLFEHIDTGDLVAYQAPTPLPTATPEPTDTPVPTPTEAPSPTPVPTDAPTDAPAAAPAVEATPEEKGSKEEAAGFLGRFSDGTLALYAASGVFVIVALCLVKKRRSLALLLLVMAGLLAYVGYSLIPKAGEEKSAQVLQTEAPATPTPTAAPTDTPVPTDTPTPAPTDAPTPTPTPEPTPTPDPNDQYFRQEGDPAEVVIQDYDNGHWEYRSDILSVIINRVVSTESNGHTYWRYVAHIRMREVNSFRSIVSARTEVAQANEPPWRIARNYRAVLAITGDNINNADVNLKGILIRNGILYSDQKGDSTLVMYDDLTMRIYHPGEISGIDLLDSGVTTAYSFGPILVENGQIHPDVNTHRVSRENPRCGVGMVEPGHFVAIVSDGRDVRRAYGYTLPEFAQLFVDEGAQLAYNMDGGNSAGMVFMGEHINWHSVGSQRTWADALVWGYSRLVPKVNDPVQHYGDGALH